MEELESSFDGDEMPESSSPSIQREEEHDEYDEALEPTEIVERSLEEPPAKRMPVWFRETLQEVEKHVAPPRMFRESKRPQKFAGYVALVSQINDAAPILFEEVAKHQVWKYSMLDNTNQS